MAEKPWCYDRLIDAVRRDWDAHDKTCKSMDEFWLGYHGGVTAIGDITDCNKCGATFYYEGLLDLNWQDDDAESDYRCECCRRTEPEPAEVCFCGKTFEPCPLCGEFTCLDCEDWERHHSLRAKFGRAWRHYVSRWFVPRSATLTNDHRHDIGG
jgi:hypothetical protein